MSLNPYKELGVSKEADDKQIKAAYRRLSKMYHPDAEGGSEEKFQEIKLSRDILLDPKRRKRFDETGRADESKVTVKAIQAFMDSLVETVVQAQRADGSTDDPTKENIRDRMVQSLYPGRQDAQDKLFKTQRKLERTERLLEAFKADRDFDPVGIALGKQKEKLTAQFHELQDAIELSIEAERILKNYEYKVVGPELEGQFSPRPTARRSGHLRIGDYSGSFFDISNPTT